MASNIRYRSIRILGNCEHCGAPLPIPGPIRQIYCTHCQGLNRRSADFWIRLFDRIDCRPQSGEFLHNQVDVRVTEPPEHLEDDVFDAPDWVHPIDAKVVHRFFGAAQEGVSGAAVPLVEEAAQPVVMSCPKCSAALEVTGESERTVTCQYCQSAVYLPDPLWQRLHPALQAEWWFVEYRGEPVQKQRDRQDRAREEAQLEAERQRKERNRQRERQLEAEERQEQEKHAARQIEAAAAAEPRARSGASPFGVSLAVLIVVAAGALTYFVLMR